MHTYPSIVQPLPQRHEAGRLTYRSQAEQPAVVSSPTISHAGKMESLTLYSYQIPRIPQANIRPKNQAKKGHEIVQEESEVMQALYRMIPEQRRTRTGYRDLRKKLKITNSVSV